MTIKFTKTGVGAEFNIETLLFEFKDEECPKELNLEYETALATNQYVGSLQTNQMQGIYLQPITWQGTFFGGSLDIDNNYITAKERADELDRLQGRVIKWWYEGIKQLVIIKKFKYTYKGYNDVDYEITLQPHDIQIAIKPSDKDVTVQENLSLISDDVTKNKPNPSVDPSKLTRTNTVLLEVQQKADRLKLLHQEGVGLSEELILAQNYYREVVTLTDKYQKKILKVPPTQGVEEARKALDKKQKAYDVNQKAVKALEKDLGY